MVICNYISKQGNHCKHIAINGYVNCHLKSHWEKGFESMASKKNVDFAKERTLVNTDNIEEVEADGACLFRSLSRGLFYACGRDLERLHKMFESTGYMPDRFLADYMDIAECFMSDDYVLDTDMEEQISRGLQKVILQFIKDNALLNVGDSITLAMLIEMCHEMSFEEYVSNYERYAGDEDFILGENKEKIELEDRWGGAPEIIVFTRLFEMSVEVFVPQKLGVKYQPVPILKILRNTNIFLKKIDKYSSYPECIKLLLRNLKNGAHYDYIK